MAWHGKCYTPRTGDTYPVAKLATYDEDKEDELDDAAEEAKFKYARNGDNFMVPFQCDLCHFRNITKRNLRDKPEADKTLLIGIGRAILDSFWSRAKSTVNNNTNGIKKFYNIGTKELCIDNTLPQMGPFLLKDDWGMHIAVIILRRSMDKGRYKETVQFETARKLRSVYSNCWGASIHTLKQGVMTKDTTKTFVTQCPTYGLWFERFVKGLHSRMGDNQCPDTAICSKLMKLLMCTLELKLIIRKKIITLLNVS